MIERAPARRLVQALTLCALVSTSGCVAMDDVMASIFGRSMRSSASFDPYEDPLSPPEGSVPFSSANFTAAPGQLNTGQDEAFGGMYIEVTPQALGGLDPEGLARIDAVQNPVVADARSRARGEVMYERNCTICHGADAAGPTDAFLGVWPLLAAYPLTAPVTLDRTDGYLYGMISVGRGAMPAYGQRIPFWDRWDVVNYLRTLQGIAPNSGAQGSPDPDPAPAAEAAGGGEES